MNKLNALILIGLAAFSASFTLAATPSPDAGQVGEKKAEAPAMRPRADLLMPQDFEYKGAFRLPLKFKYSLGNMAYSHARKTLFISGFDSKKHKENIIAEASIPEPKTGKVKGLPTAELKSKFFDPSNGLIASQRKKGEKTFYQLSGLLISDVTGEEHLYYSLYEWSHPVRKQVFTHGVRFKLDAESEVSALFKPGKVLPQSAGGYMCVVPKAFRDKHLGGKWLLVGSSVTRHNSDRYYAKASSKGPAAYVIDPKEGGDFPKENKSLAYKSMVHFLEKKSEGWEPTHSTIRGVVWPVCEGKQACIYFGRSRIKKGVYEATARFIDPQEFAKVLEGKQKPSEVKPYHVWKMDFIGARGSLGNAAYDKHGQRLFLCQPRGDSTKPIVHVLKLRTAGKAK